MLRKRFISDSILNIIATAIPLLILQLISLPIVGAKYNGEKYGLVVTLISLFTLLSFPFGNVLNNVRLLTQSEYKEKSITGDFNILLMASVVFSSIFIIIGTIYFEEMLNIRNILLITIISCLNIMREYLVVSFRLTLNYSAIVINNIILSIGYLVGTLVFYKTGYWQFIYILGLGFSLFYIINKSNLLEEKFKVTKLFKKTTYKSFVLFCSSFLNNILTYADKLLLFPLLGPSAVSIYYTATIFGKIISMMINPINSVMLSYLTKMEKVGTKKLVYIIFSTTIIGIISYFVTILISYPLLNLLYPQWADESLELIYVTTATAIIGVICSVIHPFILRFKNINWQLLISGTNVALYVILGVLFYDLYGLLGFCIGMLIANALKLIIMIAILAVTINKENKLKTL